ncbi:MAG: NADPH:quinone oxidoreductase family protein [Kofleriaceae bacterium]|nr:NADPH:quinone oxidoreductase family protein [Kofleriaceae bacterium]
MKAWRVHTHGDFRDVLIHEDCPAPTAPEDGVVIDVSAIGLNFPDLLAIAGKYQVRPTMPFVPGMEASGRIVSVGEKSKFKVGQRVIANGLWGSYAEQMAAADHYTFAIPDSMSDEDAAALHVIYQTSYMGLCYRANLLAGETLLVHGGSGGVGTSAIQIGKALGATVIATASTSEKLEVCKRAGADHLINYRENDFVAEVKSLTDGAGADVIYDPVGGDVFDKSSKCIAFSGRLLVIGFASGRIPEIAANRILLKNISIVGLHWGNYYQKAPHLVAETHEKLLALYEAGSISPIRFGEYNMDQLPEAQAAIAERRSFGKVVVRVGG